jgi:hypothetical protein
VSRFRCAWSRARPYWLAVVIGLLATSVPFFEAPLRAQESSYAAPTQPAANAGSQAAATALGGRVGRVVDGQWPAHLQSNSFPALPPSPDQAEPLPDLYEELWHHGGSFFYRPEGDQLNWPDKEHSHYEYLRLPEDWIAPEPITLFADFLGADPIRHYPRLSWPLGYDWEPRFVAAGSYEVFGTLLEQGNQNFNVIGHQLIVDLDLRLTGTEKFHVQFRPFGQDGSGGSYLRFQNPDEFIDNSTLEPQRYWFEGEFHSMFSDVVDPFAPLDFGISVGRVPYSLHNSLLMNDEFVGVILNKNSIYFGSLSNLNLQWFYGFNEVDAFTDGGTQMFGIHAAADHRGVFYEATYAFARHAFDSTRDSHFAALSRTKMYGRNNIAARTLFKWGDESGRGSGQLFTIEANRLYHLDHARFDVKHFTLFCNAFVATEGWNGLGGGNFNRLRTAFEVDPLVRIASGAVNRDTVGVALGAQIFRKHEDESFIPEIAFEAPGGEAVLGIGMRYLRKTSSQSFLDILGSLNYSDDPILERKGLFMSHIILF